jgi:hypothetical protein
VYIMPTVTNCAYPLLLKKAQFVTTLGIIGVSKR